MSKEKRRVPKLRFPGFTEDWEQRKLTSFTQRVKGNDGRMDLPTLTISASEGWLNQKDRFSANIAGSEQKNYTLLRQGELSYNHGNSKLAKYGVVYALKDYKEALVPRVYHSFRVDESYDALFVEYYFSTKRPDRELGKLVSSGARMDGLLNIGYDEFTNISISVPTFSEQKQIVALLKVCDKYITLHQRKLNNLKLKKKALLQKLFPKNGERYPELRFPGFTDAWEQRKLSDISTKVTTKNVDVHYMETLTNSAEQGIISQVDFFDKEISNKDNINGYYIVENNDFIYNPRISTLAPVGPINRNKLNRTGIMSPLYTVFRASNVDLGFLEWYFQSSYWHRYMKLNGDSGARADRIAIKDSTFFDMPIKTPVNIKEQVLIGEILEKFNQYITLHQRKLDHLQLQKKALLQQMFV
ncbi:restriction endonuclease subunit S [Veillonella sp.]|uniref:restriction endonuclease subunit S n=2 Tax=Veillonella sp. TaxID=1926307 RepID=UPI002910C6A9|nr:restriction endonuclease subunit S [Veillonella sp.]MDU4006756.1 restriction endonuclease subunit S [Veillonella sp.]